MKRGCQMLRQPPDPALRCPVLELTDIFRLSIKPGIDIAELDGGTALHGLLGEEAHMRRQNDILCMDEPMHIVCNKHQVPVIVPATQVPWHFVVTVDIVWS